MTFARRRKSPSLSNAWLYSRDATSQKTRIFQQNRCENLKCRTKADKSCCDVILWRLFLYQQPHEARTRKHTWTSPSVFKRHVREVQNMSHNKVTLSRGGPPPIILFNVKPLPQTSDLLEPRLSVWTLIEVAGNLKLPYKETPPHRVTRVGCVYNGLF
jgi:hypothetical protein